MADYKLRGLRAKPRAIRVYGERKTKTDFVSPDPNATERCTVFRPGFLPFPFPFRFSFRKKLEFKGGHKYVGPPRASPYHGCSVLSAQSVIKEPTIVIDTNGFQSSDLQMSKPVQWLALIMIALGSAWRPLRTQTPTAGRPFAAFGLQWNSLQLSLHTSTHFHQ